MPQDVAVRSMQPRPLKEVSWGLLELDGWKLFPHTHLAPHVLAAEVPMKCA